MKQNIILLHGALGSQNQVEALKQLLSPSFNTYSLNFEGHGGRPSEAAFSIDLFTQNTLNFLEENNIKQSHIFGYSMGGYVGLNLALKHPNYVQSIVTLGTKFDWTPETAAKEIKMLNPSIIEEKVPKFAQKLKDTHAPNDWKKVLNKTADMMVELGNGKRLVTKDLQQIKHRILIGIGALDRMVSIVESKEAAEALNNGELTVIEGFHHPMEKNDPNQLANIITSFIENE